MAADLSQLSDADLLAAHAGVSAAPPVGVSPPLVGASPDLAGGAAPVSPLQGLSDDELMRHYANSTPQMEGVAREVALPASGVAKGALAAIGLPGSAVKGAINLYSNFFGAPLQNLITGKQDAPVFSGDNPWTSQAFQDTGRKAGIVDRPDLAPQNTRERIEAAAAEGVGGALPFAGLGGLAAVPSALVQGAGAGAGAHLASEVAPDHPILATLVGGALGGKAGGATLTTATRAANAARGVSSPLVEAYDRLGITPSLAGDVSQNAGMRSLQAFASKAPGGAGRMEEAGTRAVSQFGDAVDRTAADLGASRDAIQAGEAAQRAARNWTENVFPQRQAQAWAPVNAAVAPDSHVFLDNYRTALNGINGELGALQKSGGTFLGERAQRLLDSLNVDLPHGAPAYWTEAQRLRSVIGEARGIPEISQSIGDARLGRLYASLSGDMRSTANRYGAGQAFDDANAVSTAGHTFQDNVLSKIIKSSNPAQESVTPTQAANNLLNSDGTILQAVRNEMPDAANELAAYKLRDMALATPGRQNAGGNATAPGTFLTDLNNMRQSRPGAMEALFPEARHQQTIGDLAHVADSMKQTALRVNNSNTGAHNQMAALVGLSEAVPAAFGGYELGGLPGAVAGGVGGALFPFAAGNVASRVTSSPAFSRFMATPVPERSALLSTILRSGGTYPAVSPALGAPQSSSDLVKALRAPAMP
jgi:hypothetical protein